MAVNEPTPRMSSPHPTPLQQALEALQCELEPLLRKPAGSWAAPSKIRVELLLSAEASASPSATVSWKLAAPASITTEDAASGRTQPAARQHHVLTLEWDPGASTPLPAAPHVAQETGLRPTAAPPVENRFEMLCQIIGKPGFDSSSRAEVLAEVLERCGTGNLLAALADLHAPDPPGMAPDLRLSRHQLRGILRSGASGSLQHGSSLLRQCLDFNGLTETLGLLRREWRTQADWL